MPSARLFDIGSGPPAVAVIGADAALAARPATPVQLAHACLKAGFSTAVPASWGDELVATECLRQLGARDASPAVFCACPLVSRRLFAPGPELAPFLVSTVSPPVATARYVRRLFAGAPVRLVYVGSCPGAGTDEFDARVLPADFLAELREAGIHLLEQPIAFDGVIPPDRRRHCSLPGGLPAPERLASLMLPRPAVEVTGGAADLAQHLVTDGPVLLDLALTLGCACAGGSRDGRAEVQALEPPRAPHAIVNHGVDIVLSQPLPIPMPAPPPTPSTEASNRAGPTVPPPHPRPATRTPTPHPAGRPVTPPTPRTPTQSFDAVTPREPLEPTTGPGRKRGTTGFFRAYTGAVPRTRSGEGRALPRAYVSRRRTPSSIVPSIDPATPPAGSRAPEPETAPPPATIEHERPIALSREPEPAASAVEPATTAAAAAAAPPADVSTESTDQPVSIDTVAESASDSPAELLDHEVEQDADAGALGDAPSIVATSGDVAHAEAQSSTGSTDATEDEMRQGQLRAAPRRASDITMDALVASPRLTTEVYPPTVDADVPENQVAPVTREALWTTPAGVREPLWTTPTAPHPASPAVPPPSPIQIAPRSRIGPRIVGGLVVIAVIGAGVVYALRHQTPAPPATRTAPPTAADRPAAPPIAAPPADSLTTPAATATPALDSAVATPEPAAPAPAAGRAERPARGAAAVTAPVAPGAFNRPTVFARPGSAGTPSVQAPATTAAATPSEGERDSIRHEIARKQARVDSLQHTFDSLQKAERARKP